MRYQLEALAAMLHPDAAGSVSWLVEVQDALGQGQDVSAVEATLRATRRGRMASGAGCLAEWRDRTRREGMEAWDRLRAGRAAWRRRLGRAFG